MQRKLFTAAATFLAALFTNADAFASTLSPPTACAAEAMQALLPASLIDELTIGQPIIATTPDETKSGRRVVDPRQLLADLALKLRDIRYRNGGRAPATGFDCSGFVQYVFAQALGIELPDDSASQFAAGVKVARADLRTGDLVFFHTRGKHVSHVGIYLGEGRFIHSPRTGERVRVNNLDENYWSHRFVGAKRPESLSS